MAVLTQKELKEKSTKKKPSVSVEPEEVTPVAAPAPSAAPRYQYVLMHPENGREGPRANFQDSLIIDGKVYKRDLKNGVLRTEEKVLAEYLVKLGWVQLERKLL